MFKAANRNRRAFIRLGLNCGYGSADIGRLPSIAGDCEPIDQPATDFVMGHTPK
ncbi:MAG: hypothetical protein WBD20_01660 [Pirellulaceae bacterium]